MDSLEGRIAVVTGGGRGIGRAIAIALAEAGAHVAIAARTVPEIEAVAADVAALGRRTFFFPLDVSDRAALARVPAVVAGALGPIDVLVNDAGMDASGPLQRMDDATWDAVLAVNLTAPALLTRAVLPSMYERGWGRVLTVASIAGKVGLKYGAAYSAAKHGVIGFTRSVALEAARKGVTVNAICPGWTETRMMDDAVEAAATATGRAPDEIRRAFLASTPIGRAALPDEVAAVAVMLARNPAITGQAIHVDGGEVQG